MIFMVAYRVSGRVCAAVYVGRRYAAGWTFDTSTTIATALRECWQWTVDNFADFPVQGSA